MSRTAHPYRFDPYESVFLVVSDYKRRRAVRLLRIATLLLEEIYGEITSGATAVVTPTTSARGDLSGKWPKGNEFPAFVCTRGKREQFTKEGSRSGK